MRADEDNLSSSFFDARKIDKGSRFRCSPQLETLNLLSALILHRIIVQCVVKLD